MPFLPSILLTFLISHFGFFWAEFYSAIWCVFVYSTLTICIGWGFIITQHKYLGRNMTFVNNSLDVFEFLNFPIYKDFIKLSPCTRTNLYMVIILYSINTMTKQQVYVYTFNRHPRYVLGKEFIDWVFFTETWLKMLLCTYCNFFKIPTKLQLVL